uniref:Uncharacterized protein n=1 Tax=Moniliophthora roreri TaxID=221103 RepID=A0A0W0GBB4_MONRR
MNWGLIVSYLNVTGGRLDSHIIVFFAGTICWTIIYDTIYGCQDKDDDVKIGVKSTSILFGERVRGILAIFACSFLSCMTYAGVRNGHSIYFFVISCGGAAFHLSWQLATWNHADREDCGRKFESNGNMGYIIWIGLALDYWVKVNNVSNVSG